MLKYLWVFLISMVPIIELRGAIPIGIGMGLDKIPTFIIAIIGNMIPVPFIFFFARKLLEWGQDKKIIGKFCSWCLRKGHKGQAKLEAKSENDTESAVDAEGAEGQVMATSESSEADAPKKSKGRKAAFIALMLFVGIPLPGTGAWTGTLAATFLDMKFKDAVIAVVCGVLIAGVIMLLASMGLFGALDSLFFKG